MDATTIWEKFLPDYGIPANATLSTWRQRLLRSQHISPTELLFALAFRESEKGDPKDQEGMNQLAADLTCGQINDYSGFFYRQNEALRAGLARFGVELLRSKDGTKCQYLRTIHRLSGAMYVLFATTVARLVQAKGWESVSDEQCVGDQLAGQLQRFFNNKEEREETQKDICGFFAQLADYYSSTHQRLLPEDLCRQKEELREPVAKQILSKFDNIARERGGGDALQTFPVLRLVDGRPVYHLPETGTFPDSWQFRVAFTFERIDGVQSVVRFESDGGSWRRVAVDPDIPFSDVLSISEHWKEGQQQQKDITPSFDGRFVLFDEARPDSPIVRSDNLVAGGRYLVAAIPGGDGNVPAVMEWWSSADDDVVHTTPIETGRFSVPPDAGTVRIEDREWGVRSDADLWLNPLVRFGSCGGVSPHGRVANARSRLFFTAGTHPISWDRLPRDARLFYRMPGSPDVELSPNGPPAPGIEWKKGHLVCRTGGSEIRRPVTFLPEVDSAEVNAPFCSGTNQTVSIRIGDYKHSCHVDDGTARIEFTVPGHDDFDFRFDVLHRGVFIECDHPGRPLFRIPIPSRIGPGTEPVEIAYEDARLSSLVVVSGSGDSEPRLISPERDCRPRLLARRRIPLVQLLGGGMCVGRTWKIDIDAPGESLSFPFRIFLPEDEPVDDGRDPLVWRRQNEDLVLSFHVARAGVGRPFRLGFVPLHRMEAKPVFRDIPSDRIVFTETDRGPLLATATLPGFFSDETIEWDNLRCFISRLDVNPDGTSRIRLCSRGFKLEVDNERQKDVPFYMSLPLGEFRLNLAYLDKEAVLSWLQTDDSVKRGEVESLVFEMTKNISEFGTTVDGRTAHHFFDLYSCGLAFAADWFVQKVYANDGELPDLRALWNPILVRSPFDDARRQAGEKLKDSLKACLFYEGNDPDGVVSNVRDELADFLDRFGRDSSSTGSNRTAVRFGKLDEASFRLFFSRFPKQLGTWRAGHDQQCFHGFRKDWLADGIALRDWLAELKKIDDGAMHDLFVSARGARGSDPIPWRTFVFPESGAEFRIPRSISELVDVLARPFD